MKKSLVILTNKGKLTEELTVLLSSLGEIEKVITFRAWAKADIGVLNSPDIVLYDDSTPIDFERYGQGMDLLKTPGRLAHDLYRYKRGTKFFGFGNGALFLALLKGCDILQSVENHDEDHSATFLLEDYETIKAVVPSKHNAIMYPIRSTDFNIRAFSTYNRSNKYMDKDGKFIKMHDKFVEPEIIKFEGNKYVAFQYNPPAIKDSLAFSLTLENMKE